MDWGVFNNKSPPYQKKKLSPTNITSQAFYDRVSNAPLELDDGLHRTLHLKKRLDDGIGPPAPDGHEVPVRNGGIGKGGGLRQGLV